MKVSTYVEQPENSMPNHNGMLFLISSLAFSAMLKSKGYSCAFRFYPSGGAGFNIYKYNDQKQKALRLYALDYHPIWDPNIKAHTHRLHYHRGESFKEIKKHRPYQGW